MRHRVVGGTSWVCRLVSLLLALCLPLLLGFTLPGEFGRIMDAGNKAYARGDYKRAASRYGNALEVTPDSPEALFNRGAARYKSGDFTAALEDFTNATRGATGTLKEHAEYNAGNCDYKMQDYDGAIESYKRALTLDPADAWAKHNLEMALRAKQQKDKQQQKQDQQKQDQQKQDQQKQDQQKQDQQKQDQQKQDQQKQDQQKQDQQKQDQQKQDQQKQDQQKQDQQKQDQQKQDRQQQDQQQQDRQKQDQQRRDQQKRDQQEGQSASAAKQGEAQPMTPEQAAQLLSSLAREDASLQKVMRRAPMTPEKPTDKDW